MLACGDRVHGNTHAVLRLLHRLTFLGCFCECTGPSCFPWCSIWSSCVPVPLKGGSGGSVLCSTCVAMPVCLSQLLNPLGSRLGLGHQLPARLTACCPLDSQDSGSLCFCFRWLLIWFKREFPFPDVLRLWEVGSQLG